MVTDGRLDQAEQFIKDQKWLKAIGLLRELLLENPEDPYILYSLGRAYYSHGDKREAEPLLKKSLSINPDNADAHLFLGLIYEQSDRKEEAEKEFQAVLKLIPDYEDAKLALERIEESKKPVVEKEKFTPEQKRMIEEAKKAEKERDYITASRLWYQLYSDDPTNAFFTYRMGQVLGWMSRPHEAIYFLKKTLELAPDQTDAMLRLGFQEMALGRNKMAQSLFEDILAIDGERVDALDGLSRSFFLQGRYCEAKSAALRRFGEGDPDYFIYKLYNRILNKTNMFARGILVWSQERETDLTTRTVTVQLNNFASEVKGSFPFTERFTAKAAFLAGTTRERNLINGTNNLFIPYNIVNGSAAWQVHSKVILDGGIGVQHGHDTGDPNFRLGKRTRVQPSGAISYSGVNQSYSLLAYVDSLTVKLFGTGRATFMQRDTYQFEALWNLFENRVRLNTTNFLRYSHDVADNRQWDCSIWAESGYPRYGSVLFLRYTGRASGFKTNESDYYSYKRQWEHNATLTFSRDTVLNTEVDLAYSHRWQWNRKLNQPVNTAVLVNKLYRGSDTLWLELRHLYRPNIRGVFRSEYYFDTTNYKAWSVKGRLNLGF
ncbi:MAG: Cell division coordinator CpoB [Chlamydiales bacterium]|nr:Cell division coordinator CpoB [Chlamydiales bacterium]MCH9619303.1 Cell division coordinator CpoB [Chlamydiales bacterium]MCH9622565.1 Cell division coordinator CpoB [Chlamydiales bacterium]